jgi:hypothetical protein
VTVMVDAHKNGVLYGRDVMWIAEKMTGIVHRNVALRRVRANIVAVKQ